MEDDNKTTIDNLFELSVCFNSICTIYALQYGTRIIKKVIKSSNTNTLKNVNVNFFHVRIFFTVQEVMGPNRVIAGVFTSTSFALGNILLTLAAWGVPAWRHLTLVLYAPQLLTICYYWLVPESVRWYMIKGRYDRAEASIKHAARLNGKELSEKTLLTLSQTFQHHRISSNNNVEKSWLVMEVFRHKPILLRCLVSPVWWITMTFVYYGLSINAVNMAGNQYVNYALSAAVEIPGYWSAMLLMRSVGRKPVLISGYWICAACQVAYIFLPEGDLLVDIFSFKLT